MCSTYVSFSGISSFCRLNQVRATAGIFICLREWVLWDLKPVKTFFNQNTSLTLCLSFQLQIPTNPLQKELA